MERRTGRQSYRFVTIHMALKIRTCFGKKLRSGQDCAHKEPSLCCMHACMHESLLWLVSWLQHRRSLLHYFHYSVLYKLSGWLMYIDLCIVLRPSLVENGQRPKLREEKLHQPESTTSTPRSLVPRGFLFSRTTEVLSLHGGGFKHILNHVL